MDSRSVEFWVQEIYHRIAGILSPGNAGINVRVTDPLSGSGSVKVSIIDSQVTSPPTSPIGTVQIYDSVSGIGKGLAFYSGQPVVTSQPYLYAVAEGDIPGHSMFRKLCACDSISSTEVTVWAPGTTYTFPSVSGQQMEVISSNTNDSSSGTGIRTVQVKYLDTSYNEQTEVVTLNGTNAVPTTATNITRINRFRAITAGSGGVAAGNIDLRHLADTPIYSRIATGKTRARTGVYTVPAGKRLFITSIMVSGGTGTGARFITFTLRTNWDETADAPASVFLPSAEIAVEDGGILREFEVPISLGPQTDMQMVAIADGSGTLVRASIRGWME